MKRNNNISKSVQRKNNVAVGLFLSILLVTIIPFNVIHDHSDLQLDHNVELNARAVKEYNGLCDHEIHIGEEQQLCLLCHFAFLSTSSSPEPLTTDVLFEPLMKEMTVDKPFSIIALFIATVLNKGSPDSTLLV